LGATGPSGCLPPPHRPAIARLPNTDDEISGLGAKKEAFSYSCDGRLYSVDFSPDGKVVAAGTNGAVLLFDIASGKLLRALEVSSSGPVFAVVFSPDGSKLAAASYDNIVFVWTTADFLPPRAKAERGRR
jgi:WD40 repeat protein